MAKDDDDKAAAKSLLREVLDDWFADNKPKEETPKKEDPEPADDGNWFTRALGL